MRVVATQQSCNAHFYYPGTRVSENFFNEVKSHSIMFTYVYVIESIKNDGLYIGFTKDLKQRLKQHNDGLNKSTRPYTPWKLVFYESYINEKDAARREKYLKTSQGSRLLKRMLKEYFYEKKYKK